MRRLRTLVVAAAAFVLGAALVSAQSLAEVAKKEKDRRNSNKTESKRVITDRELSSSYRGLPPTSSTVATTQASGEEGPAAEGTGGEESKPQDEAKTQEYWQNRMKASKEKIAKLEQDLQAENWGDGQRVGVDPRGMNNLAGRQEAEKQLAAARAELEAIRAEARRAGVPPGWIR